MFGINQVNQLRAQVDQLRFEKAQLQEVFDAARAQTIHNNTLNRARILLRELSIDHYKKLFFKTRFLKHVAIRKVKRRYCTTIFAIILQMKRMKGRQNLFNRRYRALLKEREALSLKLRDAGRTLEEMTASLLKTGASLQTAAPQELPLV